MGAWQKLQVSIETTADASSGVSLGASVMLPISMRWSMKMMILRCADKMRELIEVAVHMSRGSFWVAETSR